MLFSDEQAVDLSNALALDTDAAGTVYALLRHEEGDLRIVLLDGRQEMLGAQQRQGSLHESVRITAPTATHVVRTQPSINFDVRGLQVAPSGRYLVLHGNDYQDSSVLVLAVVDLHGGQPLPASAAAAARGASAARQKQCRLLPVDPLLFSSRPGLVLYQASWHAHSEEHLLLLTSDNRLRLYHVTHSLAAAEQTLHIVPSAAPQPQRYGLSPWGGGGGAAAGTPGGAVAASSPTPLALGSPAGGAAAPASGDMVAFAFGPATGWGQFALLLLAADGHVYVLGPVAPFGMRVAATALERLGREAGAAAEWLEAAFGQDAVGNPLAKHRWPVLPHVVEGVSPGLIGPLNPRWRQELPLTSRAVSLALSHALVLSSSGPSSGLGGGGGGSPLAGGAPEPAAVSTAVVAFADGRLLAYAAAGPWAPVWCDSPPQYMAPPGAAAAAGAAPSAVRYKCSLVSTAAAGTTAAAGAAVTTPRMILLDVVELPAASASAEAARSGPGRPSVSEPDDEDEEGEEEDGDGFGASTSYVAAARRAMAVHIQAGAAGGGGGAAAAAGAATVWAVQRAGGCWRVMLPWSALLPRWLGGGGGGGAAAGGREPLPTELPAPVVTCVYDVGAASQGARMTPASAATAVGAASVVGSCLLANPLLGGGLLMLSAAGSLHFFQPAGTASLLMDQQQQQASAASPAAVAAATPALSPAAAAGGAAAAVLPSPEQRKAQVEAHIKDVYGSLLAPPADRGLPKPPAGAPSPLTVSSPEGLRFLLDAISALRGKHVAFAHGASAELTERAAALRAEAAKHGAAAAELAELAGRLEARQAGLEGRLGRLRQLHDNLVERAGMLARLHWSLPRALSRAEQAMREELAGVEGRAASLQAQWGVLAERARRLCEERRGGGPGGGGRGGGAALRVQNVPEAQLEKVHDAVVAQYRGLTAARAALAALEQALAAAAADRAAAELDKGLGLGGAGLASPAPSMAAAGVMLTPLGLPAKALAA